MDDYKIEAATKAEWAERALRAEARVKVLSALLTRAIENTGEPDCWYDHHGYCQAHNLEPKGECWVEQSKAAIEGEK